MTSQHRRVPFSMRILLAALLTLLIPANAVAAPANDNFADRIVLDVGSSDSRSNTGAGIEPGERLTEDDPQGHGCNTAGAAAPDGLHIGATLWWEFTGDGGPITVSSAGSGIDTILAVYDTVTGGLAGCNDDVG